MRNIINLLLVITLLASFTSPLAAQERRGSRNQKDNEEVETEAEENEEERESNSEQDGEFEEDIAVDYETYVLSVNNANEVVESINKFLDDSNEKLEAYDFIDSQTQQELIEELSDLKTQLASTEADLDNLQINTFLTSMPGIKNELLTINTACINLSEKHQEAVMDSLNRYMYEEHAELYSSSVSIFEQYSDFLEEKNEIEQVLDDTDELVDDLEDEIEEEDAWEDLIEKEEELLNLFNAEAARHRND